MRGITKNKDTASKKKKNKRRWVTEKRDATEDRGRIQWKFVVSVLLDETRRCVVTSAMRGNSGPPL